MTGFLGIIYYLVWKESNNPGDYDDDEDNVKKLKKIKNLKKKKRDIIY